MKIRPFVAALLLILSVCSSPVSAGDLEARLLEMSKQIDGRVALYARNLDSGREVGINADEPVRTASTINRWLETPAHRKSSRPLYKRIWRNSSRRIRSHLGL